MECNFSIARLLAIFWLAAMVCSSSPQSFAAEETIGIPKWLKEHIGHSDGQIAPVVLQRARALYLRKLTQGVVKNQCYFAMDATQPNDLGDRNAGRRFYIICESKREFKAVSAGHGSGRDLKGLADFSNGRRCAKNFSNALDSRLTAGGDYVTAETKTSFKGYYRLSATKDDILLRSFVQFDGEGDTANARQRLIGGHPAVLLKNVCLGRRPASPYASQDGYVPFGKLVSYERGRSDGCTSWSPSDAQQIIAILKDNPTTLYIYPDSADVSAVAQAVADRRPLSSAGLYWNESCLKEIGSPKFWPKETLEPILLEYKNSHPPGPERPIPICKGS